MFLEVKLKMMTTLYNEITIDVPVQKVWDILSSVEKLEKYDPTVKSTVALSQSKQGVGAIRRVTMVDGKNWFEEEVTESSPYENLVFELTSCSFPVHNLKHSYSFEQLGEKTKVKQVMNYLTKYGVFGMLLDLLIMRKQSDRGIKLFFKGLKSYTESKEVT